MHTRFARALAVSVAILLCGIPQTTFAAGWQSGVAKIDITPTRPMWMAGYGNRDHLAEGKLTELWAKALILDDGSGHRGLLITLDLLGIDSGLSHRVCDKLMAKYGLEREQIALCMSHTHTGPVVARNCRPMHYEMLDDEQKQRVDRYADALVVKIVDVAGRAFQKLAPSQLSWGSGTADFAVNRRNNRPESKVPEWRAAGSLKGPVDHDVPVLAIKDSDGRLKTILLGYACHCTTLSFYKWSGDYAGFAQIELEQAHPDCVAMFWAGCGGDQNPLPRRTVALAKDYGRQLAEAVNRVLSTEMPGLPADLRTTYREIDLPLAAPPSRSQIEQDAESQDKYVASRARMFLADMAAGHPLPRTYPYPVQVWRIGKVRWVILGGEVVIDYALRLKAEMQGKKTWVASYANDVMAYIPSRRILREGGYEGGGAMVYYGLPAPWEPAVEDQIVDEVRRQATSP